MLYNMMDNSLLLKIRGRNPMSTLNTKAMNRKAYDSYLTKFCIGITAGFHNLKKNNNKKTNNINQFVACCKVVQLCICWEEVWWITFHPTNACSTLEPRKRKCTHICLHV